MTSGGWVGEGETTAAVGEGAVPGGTGGGGAQTADSGPLALDPVFATGTSIREWGVGHAFLEEDTKMLRNYLRIIFEISLQILHNPRKLRPE